MIRGQENMRLFLTQKALVKTAPTDICADSVLYLVYDF